MDEDAARRLPPRGKVADVSTGWRRQNVIISLRFSDSRSGVHNPCGANRTVGEWLSLVEHLVRDQGVGGSNPLSPTILFLAQFSNLRSFRALRFHALQNVATASLGLKDEEYEGLGDVRELRA